MEALSTISTLTEAPFYVSTMPAALTDLENLLMVMTAIKEIGPVMVIFDTWPATWGGGDQATKTAPRT